MAGTSVLTPKLTVGRLLERLQDILQLERVTRNDGIEREIHSPNVSSPGLVLAGYVERFPARRIQVLGETEIQYLRTRTPDERRKVLEQFFSFPIPCALITKGLKAPDDMVEIADAAGVPLYSSRLKTNELYGRIKPWLEEEFAPSTNLHGSLADVFGVGLLLVGQSGIGKSECVLDLVERGHRLVADDLVIAKRRGSDVLIGRGHELQRHYMEIRGVGLVDVPAIFGIRAVRQQKRIEVVVQLSEWNQNEVVERGHRLVADDLVIAKRRGSDVLIGRGHELQRHYMEIRGVGLVDVPAIFGIRAVRQQKRIEVVVQLSEWNQNEVVERTGANTETTTILDVELPKISVPLNPGKNITVIAEVIAMNHLLKYSGIDPAARFNERLMRHMRAASDVRRYLQEDNE